MKYILLIIILFPFCLNAQIDNLNSTIEGNDYRIHYSKKDSSMSMIQKYVELGIKNVTNALQKDFKNIIDVSVFIERADMDKHWQTKWNMPSFQSECWMVGSGVESQLDLLSPQVWSTQACDHDPDDKNEIRLLIYHELVHVLHNDYNKSPSFDDINNIDWFVEGLATYISGQLDSERLIHTINYVRETDGPEQLSMFWKGDHKYGLSGSMIAYIDGKYGRETLTDLLVYNDVNDILNVLDITEEELVANWKKGMLNAR